MLLRRTADSLLLGETYLPRCCLQADYTLMLHTYVEEKRARVREMWLHIDSDRPRRTRPYVKSCSRRARPQMACYSASAAVFTGVGVQHWGIVN